MNNKSGFGLAHIKKEGAPAHPEDIYIHCGCAKCEARWQKQLKAYNEYYAEEQRDHCPPTIPTTKE